MFCLVAACCSVLLCYCSVFCYMLCFHCKIKKGSGLKQKLPGCVKAKWPSCKHKATRPWSVKAEWPLIFLKAMTYMRPDGLNVLTGRMALENIFIYILNGCLHKSSKRPMLVKGQRPYYYYF